MNLVRCFAILFMITAQAHAASWFEKKVDGKLLYDSFKEAEIPLPAIERTFQLLDINENRSFTVKLDEKETANIKIKNKDFAVIVDYSKPSSSRRLYLLNLQTGAVEKYFVAHGLNTGEDVATSFSNQMNSKKTSLGFYITGSSYVGGHGESLYLHGIEKSNDRAFERAIVMHGAGYVSKNFLDKYGRIGRSWGCPAVSDSINKKILPLIKDGAVFYAYHKDLMPVTQTSPTIQNVGNDQQGAAANGNQIMPEELNP